LRRHGHPQQNAIGKAELKPYVASVQRRIANNADNATWRLCEAHWLGLVGQAREVIGQAERGFAGNRYERRAALEVVRLAEATSCRQITETIFALYLMQDAEPHRFCSDAAFRTQLVRRLSALAETKEKNENVRRVMRAPLALPPRAIAIMASWVIAALGGVGVHLARLEAQNRVEQQTKRQALAKAIGELK